MVVGKVNVIVDSAHLARLSMVLAEVGEIYTLSDSLGFSYANKYTLGGSW